MLLCRATTVESTVSGLRDHVSMIAQACRLNHLWIRSRLHLANRSCRAIVCRAEIRRSKPFCRLQGTRM